MEFMPGSTAFLGAFQSAAMQMGKQAQQSMALTGAPMLRAATQWNGEAAAFLRRRIEAQMKAPQQLAACRTPQEAMQEAMTLWQAGVRDWFETSQRMLAPLTAAAAHVRVPAGRADLAAPRDYITFPEPKDTRESAPGAAWSGRGERGKRDAA